jgi:hypothetical protein
MSIVVISVLVDIFYPKNFADFGKNGVLQHPQAFSKPLPWGQ